MCKKCLTLSNGQGKEVHRTTIKRHMANDQLEQELETEYQNRYLKDFEDFMQLEESEEQNLNDEDHPKEEFENFIRIESEERNLDFYNNEDVPFFDFRGNNENDDIYHYHYENNDLSSELDFIEFDNAEFDNEEFDNEGEFYLKIFNWFLILKYN